MVLTHTTEVTQFLDDGYFINLQIHCSINEILVLALSPVMTTLITGYIL